MDKLEALKKKYKRKKSSVDIIDIVDILDGGVAFGTRGTEHYQLRELDRIAGEIIGEEYTGLKGIQEARAESKKTMEKMFKKKEKGGSVGTSVKTYSSGGYVEGE